MTIITVFLLGVVLQISGIVMLFVILRGFLHNGADILVWRYAEALMGHANNLLCSAFYILRFTN